MRLSKGAILALRGMTFEQKSKIASAAGVQTSTVYRWIENNDDNLTKAAPLQVIREETGLGDSDILEEKVIASINK